MEEDIIALFRRCIQDESLLKEFDNDDLLELGNLCHGNYAFLYLVNAAMQKGDDELVNDAAGISFYTRGEGYDISFKDKKLHFTKEQLASYLALAIDIVGDILPLGSVVDLKKEYFEGVLQVDQIENLRFIILHRFLFNEGDRFYFPYAGVVFPFGVSAGERYIYFTTPMIERVVFKGFSNEQEMAFVYLMKKELVAEKLMSSFTFAKKEDVERFHKTLNEMAGKHG